MSCGFPYCGGFDCECLKPRPDGWTREVPTVPGRYWHRNLEHMIGHPARPYPLRERQMFVGYVNWTEDHKRGYGSKPMHPYGSHVIRAVGYDKPLTADSLSVDDWGGEWKRLP